VLPDLAEARGWIGLELDDVDGREVGRIEGLYVDSQTGEPVWLVAALSTPRRGRLGGGRRQGRLVAVPIRECAAMPSRAWTAQGHGTMQSAPVVDPARPLLREHETAICAHYGIGEGLGRHAELAVRPAETITAQPAH